MCVWSKNDHNAVVVIVLFYKNETTSLQSTIILVLDSLVVRAHSFTLLKLKDIKLLTCFHPPIPPHIASSFLLSSANDKNQNNWVFANAI